MVWWIYLVDSQRVKGVLGRVAGVEKEVHSDAHHAGNHQHTLFFVSLTMSR